MRVTQKEIAEKMGVSISLVSRVLSGTANDIGIPEKTINGVKETAVSLGYVPNIAARALKGKSSRVIGVVVYDFKDPFFSECIAIIQEKLHKAGYSTILVGFTDRQIDEKDLSSLKQHILDAIIVLGSDLSGAFEKEIKSTPIFRIGHSLENESSYSFYPEEEHSAQQLASYLVARKSKDIHLLQADLPNHDLRSFAMKNALKAGGIKCQIFKTQNKRYFESGYDHVSRIIKENNTPDIIVCTIDQIALGSVKALLQKGLAIPEDIGVVGFDNIQMSSHYHPSLTTFHQPIDRVVDKIIQKISSNDYKIGKEHFTCPLIQRASC
ncbi:MAG: LacI family transcriptional regulator [Opitutales bacterium]|nr:LacI family transcriptional regulator [Opitutales bacterium]